MYFYFLSEFDKVVVEDSVWLDDVPDVWKVGHLWVLCFVVSYYMWYS